MKVLKMEFTSLISWLPVMAVALTALSAQAQTLPPADAPVASAQPAAGLPTDQDLRKLADDSVASQVQNLINSYGVAPYLPPDTQVVDPAGTSPSINKVGIGIGANTGTVTGMNNVNALSSGFYLREFGEGSSGKSYENIPDAHALTTTMLGELASQVRAQFYTDKSVSEDVREARYQRAFGILQAEFAKAAAPYIAAYDKAKKSDESRPGGRPLYVVEGSAQYNMIGSSNAGGAYTGVKGNLKAGVGFSLKDHGKNGCDIYFLAHAEASGEVYYKLENADKASGAVGFEQGPLCQIANAVTIMASPSVQVGSMEHANPNGGKEIKTDWLNYAARARMIVDKKLFVSLEYGHQPGMKTAADGSRWIANDFNGSIDYDVTDKWIVGGDFRLQSFKDANANKTGNHDVNDDFAGIHAIRAF